MSFIARANHTRRSSLTQSADIKQAGQRSNPQEQRPAHPTGPRQLFQKARELTKAAGTPARPIGTRKGGYLPVISSPLRKTGRGSSWRSGGSGSEHELQNQQKMKPNLTLPRRSLQVRVVDSQAGQSSRKAPEMRSIESGNIIRSNADRLSPPKGASLVRQEALDSVASLQSVGRDFSRYPSRQPSNNTLLTVPTPPNARAIRVPSTSGESNISGGGFDGEDPERGFSPYIQKKGGPIQYPTIDEKEDDDNLHNPQPGDDAKPRLRDCRANFTFRAFFTLLFFAMFIVGLFVLCLIWPILTYGHVAVRPHQTPDSLSKIEYGTLGAIRTSMVDPDTPKSAYTRNSALSNNKLSLVFSDEFNQDGRTFYPGEDQFWTAADLWYGATEDLEWYDPNMVTTSNGTLQLTMKAVDPASNHGLMYVSGMLQSWNQLCFKGGVMEVSASLPGPAGTTGLWPGIWSLGNLARAGYMASSDGTWPYAYSDCDAGITANQSSSDGLSHLPGQRLNSCTCKGEDHPNPGIGRGAPEIDVLEGSAAYDIHVGVVTQSTQIAPFDVWYLTDPDFIQITDLELTQMNTWKGGPFQQAVSGVTMLNNDWYDGQMYQKYAFEYQPGDDDGAIAWFVGDEEAFRMTGNAHGPNGNVGQRQVTKEPMSIVLNLGMSESWAWIDWAQLGAALTAGTIMHIDYVRIYQEEGAEIVTCDPPGYPTTQYIKEHPKAYNNPNFTTWGDTGYAWPRNTLVDECSA